MAERIQTLDTTVDLTELCPGNGVCCIARLIWVVRKTDQVTDCLQRKPKFAGMPYESQSMDSRFIVDSLVPTCAGRCRNEAYLLVVSYRLHLASGSLGDTANRQIAGQSKFLLEPIVTVDITFSISEMKRRLEGCVMDGGCCGSDAKFDGVSSEFKRALWAVIAINGAMFVVEMAAGAFAGSKALQADALDFLGDTVTYALSLYVIGMSLKVRATAALVKGLSLGAMGLWVFGSTTYQTLVLGVPSAEIMGSIGFMALAANLASVWILMRFKDGDANVRSVWLCSRNDAIGNVAVICAAVGVYFTGTAWPDLIVAALMAGLFMWSAFQIIKQAMDERRHVEARSVAAE